MVMRAVVLLWCLAATAACGRQVALSPAPPSADQQVLVTRGEGGEVALAVRVADSDAERAAGLMGVEHLPDDEGMAFVFDGPTETGFWMKDTPIPLSIAFVDDAGTIVTIREMQPCPRTPCPTYEADAPYVLAVEANAGWFARRGVEEGDRARLEETADG